MPDSLTADEGTGQVPAVEGVTPAEAPAAEKAEPTGGNKSMLDAVKAALTGTDKSPASEQTQVPNVNAEANPADAAAQEVREGFTDVEWKQLSAKTQRRIRDLAASSKDRDAKIAELQPRAENFDRISQLMQRNSLSQDEVNRGFDIMAAVKTQPEKALEMLAPLVRELLKSTGHQLPEDLQGEVQAGRLTSDHARELSVTRARADLLGKQREASEQERAESERQRQHQQLVNTSIAAADEWHKEKATADPDWSMKQNRVVELVKLHLLETNQFPKSRDEARALFEAKLKIVNDDLKRLLPKRPEIKPAIGSASPHLKPAPKTMLEAMRGALG